MSAPLSMPLSMQQVQQPAPSLPPMSTPSIAPASAPASAAQVAVAATAPKACGHARDGRRRDAELRWNWWPLRPAFVGELSDKIGAKVNVLYDHV